MDDLTRKRELTALQEKQDQILCDFDVLQNSVRKSIKAGTVSRESFAGAFLLLETQFDKFAVLVKNLEAPEEIPELPSIQEKVMNCYQDFIELKKEYEDALEKEKNASDDLSEDDDYADDEEDDESFTESNNHEKNNSSSKTPNSQNLRTSKGKAKNISPPKKKQPTQQSQKKSTGNTYHLKKITKSLSGGAYAVIENGAYRAATHTDNDVIRAALNTQYYLSTGAAVAGMMGGMMAAPGKKLKHTAGKTLSESQMRKYNAEAIRSNRQLEQRIHTLERRLSQHNGFYMPPAEKRQLEEELKNLKSGLPQSKKSAAYGRKIQDFQHHRNLDNEVLGAFTANGKMPGNPRALHEVGSQYLRKQSAALTKQFGDDFWTTSQKSLKRDIRKTMKEADSIKSQIDILEHQGKFLSADQRLHLMELKKKNKVLGSTIQGFKGQEAALKKYAYVSSQVNSVLSRADKQAQNTTLSLNFLRNTITRPLYDSENNTTFLAYEMKVLSDPRVVRNLYKISCGTAHAPYQVFRRVSPKLATKIRYQQQQEKKAQEKKEKAQQTQTSKQFSQANTTNLQTNKSTSTPIASENERKKAARKKLRDGVATKGGRKHRSMKAAFKGIQDGTVVKKVSAQAAEAMSAILEKISGKYLLIAAGVILLIVLLFGIITAICQTGMSVIFSPHEGENGKIDLGPYVTVIEQEKRKFTAMRDDLEQSFYEGIEKIEEDFNHKYQNLPKYQIIGGEDYKDKYSKINVTFDGPSSNDRELIAMMAVRFQQDLENPDAMRYLQHLASKSRELLTASDKAYEHRPGCVQVRVQVEDKDSETKPKPDGGGGGGSHVVPGVRSYTKPGGSHVEVPTKPTEPKEPTYEIQRICPGHRDLSIHIHVLTLEELFAADDWDGGPAEWQGWTEENKEWVKLFLDMDWAEIYTGFRPGGFISINGALPPEEERHIWEALESMTGNPYAAAGIMGNLHCESRLLSSNLEDHYEGILGYNDQTYTAAVDGGSYTNFVNDSCGYGLAQWTFNSRKEGLLNLAQSRGTSISDVDMQLSYLESEFHSFGMMGSLQNMSSVEEASDYILFNFERPKNPASLQPTRAGISSYFYNKYMFGSAAEGDLTQAQMDVIRIATNSEAYGIPARGGYCQAWAAYVYGKAGFPIDNSSCARVSGERYGVSSDFTIVPPGAAVYGYSSSKYGHVGIYVGGGLVYHNVGGVAVDSLADWVQKFNGFCWGWQAGTDLTALP